MGSFCRYNRFVDKVAERHFLGTVVAVAPEPEHVGVGPREIGDADHNVFADALDHRWDLIDGGDPVCEIQFEPILDGGRGEHDAIVVGVDERFHGEFFYGCIGVLVLVRQPAFQDANSVIAEEWIATANARTCPTHRNANGQVVPVDRTFLVMGDVMHYPGDLTASAENIIP